MTEVDKALLAFTANQKIIDQMTKTPFIPLINQQQLLMETLHNRLYNAFSCQCALPREILPNLEQYSKLFKAINSRFDMFSSTVQMTNTFTFPIEQICRNLSVLSQREFRSAIIPLFAAINSIHVCPDYVEAPDILTSEKLLKATPESLSQPSSRKKKLTRSDVAWLIMFLLSLLSWLCPDPLSKLQESTVTETSSITREQENQLVERLILLSEYMENHPIQPSDSISAHPEPDLLPSNSQFDVATPASAAQPNLEAGSKPGNIELNLKAE